MTRHVGYESSKTWAHKARIGYWTHYLSEPDILDIGWRGSDPEALPIVEQAIGIDLDTPGYDGFHLPCRDQSQDAVHASHVLEHVDDDIATLGEWFRVLRIGGYMLLVVPHAYLYERRLTVPPSPWSPEHKRSYTPGSLLTAVERALEPNSYRVRNVGDNDCNYDYNAPITETPVGCYEIDLVLQRIHLPKWQVEP